MLSAVAFGLSARATADALGIAVFTVRGYLKAVTRKLHARNTTHAVAIAMRTNIIG